jgi:Xaa-Pro aminopeptidase
MKYHQIDRDLFVKNRAKFTAQMKPNSVAVFNSNDIYPVSADSTLPFAQHRDIFYLSGVDQEESILLLFPDAPYEHLKEILFLKETNEHIAIWEGEKLTKQRAFEVSGIKSVIWLQDFHKTLKEVMAYAETIYINTNEHYRAVIETETREARFVKWWKENYPAHKVEKSNPILQRLRSVKESEELDLIQKACDITEKGFRRVLNFVKPNVMEYEIEAEFAHEFLRNRSKGFAYTPIIASGNNANVLHYIENNQPCRAGDILLLDVAAEYANYNADLTRSIPVSGRFTPRQREVYEAVLRVMKAAKAMLVAGNVLDEYQAEVAKVMESELLGLGLLTQHDIDKQDPDWPAYKKYFMHGTSHLLGLDVHDVGSRYRKFAPGMVFTCEPGIYIREESLGIRLENNILITETGNIDLMAHIPIEAEEIEELMNK